MLSRSGSSRPNERRCRRWALQPCPLSSGGVAIWLVVVVGFEPDATGGAMVATVQLCCWLLRCQNPAVAQIPLRPQPRLRQGRNQQRRPRITLGGWLPSILSLQVEGLAAAPCSRGCMSARCKRPSRKPCTFSAARLASFAALPGNPPTPQALSLPPIQGRRVLRRYASRD